MLPGAGEDGLPADAAAAEALHGAAAGAGGAAPPGRRAGLPRGRDEAVAAAGRCAWRRNGVDDPISHCLAGNSLLLTGLAPERRTWPGPLWRGCESRARRCTWCPRRTAPRRTWAWGRRRPTAGCAGTCVGAARKSWTGWWWRRSRSWTWRSGRTWPAREVPAAGRLPAVAGRAGLLGRAAHQRAVGAQPAHPRPGRRSSRRTCAPTPASSTS